MVRPPTSYAPPLRYRYLAASLVICERGGASGGRSTPRPVAAWRSMWIATSCRPALARPRPGRRAGGALTACYHSSHPLRQTHPHSCMPRHAGCTPSCIPAELPAQPKYSLLRPQIEPRDSAQGLPPLPSGQRHPPGQRPGRCSRQTGSRQRGGSPPPPLLWQSQQCPAGSTGGATPPAVGGWRQEAGAAGCSRCRRHAAGGSAASKHI